MKLRTFLVLGMLALVATSCTVHVGEPGTQMSNGTVYLGFDLFDNKGKADREHILVGQQYGTFSQIFLTANKPIAISKVVVVFADGQRFTAKVPKRLGAGRSSPAIALPGGPR